MTLLELQDVTVQFGSVTAVAGVTAAFPAGRVTGLIGPNGAGKTALIDALTGFVPARGSVTFDSRDITRLPADARARCGLCRTWQSLELFADLTVLENLEVGVRTQRVSDIVRSIFRPPVGRVTDRAMSALAMLGIEDVASRRPDELSYGERKLVAIARTLMLEPGFILLDEPAAGLDTRQSSALGERLREIAARGVGLLVVDHDMSLVLNHCDYIHVIEFGRIIAEGLPHEIRSNERVVTAYLGTDAAPAETAGDSVDVAR